jgi:hypothetical protein
MFVNRDDVRWLMWLAAPALTLALLGGVVGAEPAPGKPESQAASNRQLAKTLHVLQVTKKTLEAVDHDYGGHRADAVKAIGAAQRQLKLALESVHKDKPAGATAAAPKPASGAGKPAGNSEPQNVSDMQLADAIPILKATMAMLQKADHDYGGHRADAVRDLETAVKQLEKALQFVKKQGK